MDDENLQQKTTHKGREDSKLQDLQRQDSGGECVWNISEQIQGINVHHGGATAHQRPKVVRDIVFTCVVLHDMLSTQQGKADRAHKMISTGNL